MITLNNSTVTIRNHFSPVTLRPNVIHEVEDDVRVCLDEKGNCIYTKVGEKNVFEYVNSFKNGATLQSMLDRIALLPVHDKIQYLQQCSKGITGDVSCLPKDGTEAFIALNHAKRLLPNFNDLLKNGASFDDLVKAITDTYAPKKSMKEEVSTDGQIESGN